MNVRLRRSRVPALVPAIAVVVVIWIMAGASSADAWGGRCGAGGHVLIASERLAYDYYGRVTDHGPITEWVCQDMDTHRHLLRVGVKLQLTGARAQSPCWINAENYFGRPRPQLPNSWVPRQRIDCTQTGPPAYINVASFDFMHNMAPGVRIETRLFAAGDPFAMAFALPPLVLVGTSQ
jgi:hypothetical protein